MECVSGIIKPVVESWLARQIKRQLGFLFSSQEYDTKITQFKSKVKDMERKKEHNDVNSLEVPDRVPSWLKEAEEINQIIDKEGEGDSTSAAGNVYLQMKRRYEAGKQCFDVIEQIVSLLEEKEKMEWTNNKIPPCEVRSATSQVLLQDVLRNNFDSRKEIFQRALHLLKPDNTTQMVALCGMGGIGKTTMMKELEKVVENWKLFDHVVRVTIGNNTDPIAFQGAIAQRTGVNLSEPNREARADRLEKIFSAMSQDGKKKILIILDDLWKIVKLEDIGLGSPLPKGFKLFLTSRFETVCDQMGVEASSLLQMDGLKEPEANQLFWENTGFPDDVVDLQLRKVGEDIVKRCDGLPMAIKTIALALRGKRKDAWKLTLSRLHRHDLRDLQGREGVVDHIFKISYEGLQIVDQKFFVLSGLFPDDFDIPLEDLMRYGWGLKLFSVPSLYEARLQTNASVHNLIRANLLIESDRKGCVKMHDLARSFVLSNISEFKQASIVNHSDMSEWPTQDTRESCERILLNCKGMSEFPRHFDYPDLTLLKLMGNYYDQKPLKFPVDFYARMKKLQVISYRSIQYPSLVPISLQCSTSLRVLCLHSCSSMCDLSYLGHLSNLEILSFVNCYMMNLPSTIGNLKNLKLLDLTRSCNKLCIGDGVFQKLDNLEELYMRNLYPKVISFTEDNCEGLEMVSKKLTTLEVEFFENNIRPNNVSFKKLERFRISIGCHLDPIYEYSFENTLRLVSSCEEVRAFEINELFEKSENLHLQVEDMNHLEDILMHPSHQYSFCNLKHLSFERCANLKYLFTVNVASTLTNLESLIVLSCCVLESVIHGENNGVKFHKLKRLELQELPMFVGLCDNINIVMELPQLVKLRLDYLPKITCIFASTNNTSATTIPLLNEKVVCPKLEELEISLMENLKEIWVREEEDDRTPVLEKFEVWYCDEIQNLFPKNPMRLLSHLEKLTVGNCGSIEALFDIDWERIGQAKSSLRSIEVYGVQKLREVWRIRGGEDNSGLLIRDFQALESIGIYDSKNIRNIVIPTTIKFDMGALTTFIIDSSGDKWGRNNILVEFIQDEEFSIPWSLSQYYAVEQLQNIKIRSCHAITTVIPAAEQLQKIEVLEIYDCCSLMEVFETKELIDSPIFGQGSGGRDDTTLAAAIPRLQSITTHKLPNLKILDIGKCHRLVDIFTFSTLGSLGLLEKLSIRDCEELKVIMREEHEEQTSLVIIFPCLKSIILADLPKLEGFFFGMNEFQLPLLDEVVIKGCPQMMVFTPLPLRAAKLKYVDINGGKYCHSLML